MNPEDMTEQEQRLAIIAQCRWMNASGLNQGTSGNISVRHGDRMLITPSAIPYDELTPELIAAMPLAGNGAWTGPRKPSTEWRFHLDILRARPEIGAVVHTHSSYATALAITRRSIPACHYMIAAFGGNDVRCADYALYGSEALSKLVVEALDGRLGCLLANHGAIAIGPSLPKAMWLAVELETIARHYHLAQQLGEPALLSPDQIDEVARDFATYGLQNPPTLT